MAEKRVLEEGKWSEDMFGISVAFKSLESFEKAQYYLNKQEDINISDRMLGARASRDGGRGKEFTIRFTNPELVNEGFKSAYTNEDQYMFDAVRDLLVDHYPEQAIDAGFEAQVNTYATIAFEHAKALRRENGDLAIYFDDPRGAKDVAHVLDYQMVGSEEYAVKDVGKREGLALKGKIGDRQHKLVIPAEDVEKFMEAELINHLEITEKTSRQTRLVTKWSELLDVQNERSRGGFMNIKTPSLFSDRAAQDDSPQPQSHR